MNFITPALISLWDYWLTLVPQVAPPLKGKALKWYADASLKGYAYPTVFFKSAPIPATNFVNTVNQIWNGQVSATLGVQLMQDRIKAQEAAATLEPSAGTVWPRASFTNGPQMAVVTPGPLAPGVCGGWNVRMRRA